MAPPIRNLVTKNINNHQAITVFEKAFKDRDGEHSGHSAEVEAMIRDWGEIRRNHGKRNLDQLDDTIKSDKRDVDGMTDEQLSQISIWIHQNGEANKSETEPSTSDVTQFNKYKHHQYVRRWGLFSDAEGINEEWFIPNPPVLLEDNQNYLCDMCRHIDFKVLLSKRGLPGNQQPGRTSILLLGLSNILNEETSCAFCRLMRRKITEDKLLESVPEEELESMSFQLNVLDDGPSYALRLEVEILNETRRENPRFILHRMAEQDDPPWPLQGLVVHQHVADMTRLKNWLHTCDETHGMKGDEQEKLISPLMGVLRLVDTADNCIREVEVPCEYSCLSYVWGKGSHTQYTTDTKVGLETPGSLTDTTSNLPQTILDAMRVTREVGLRYIWIDALCIIQDDDQDKAQIISKMGTIYENASFTIMASTNSDPTGGLPGVSVPRSRAQIMAKIRGMPLGVALYDGRLRHSEIEDGLWNSRAWTFQERALSRKAVFFTASQMCFVCPHGAAFEDTVAVPDPDYKPTPLNNASQLSSKVPRLQDIWMRVWCDRTQLRHTNKAFETDDGITIMVGEELTPAQASVTEAVLYRHKIIPSKESLDAPMIDGFTLWERYIQSVNVYTMRNMTWQSDAVNAFVGIADLIRRGANTKFWYGLPEFAFTQSLLWQPKEPLKRRVSQDGAPLFPSWTWAAWQGHVSYRGRGWHNAIGFPPASVVRWLYESTFEESMERFTLEERTEEEVQEFTRRLRQVGTILREPHPSDYFHLDYQERGWVFEKDEVRNRHLFVHKAYPGVKFNYPISLPGQPIIDLPSKDGKLRLEARLVSASFCDMRNLETVQTPVSDNFLQIGLNDEDRSANERRPWQHIVYHQGYRAGLLSLNVLHQALDLDLAQCSKKDGQEGYFIVSISRDNLPHIAPPHIGWDLYWGGDPQMMQEMILRDEWSPNRKPPPMPNEDAAPNDDKANENGDPWWDEGRFGGVSLFDVCNVLLLRRNKDGISERIGSGKINYCAFSGAKPEVELLTLK
ncbi:uncharacterized protein NECHADRAFT_87130 [Fusarium vanettenii 77-13-4]|uniref:Heterokaryon incompatibility domain-containing protein n=1 Tax=Fusarium vanettenii (strain ATCC MYA-4622 / CBS 123669 / FGSC 9596 / NRRL 45880 / 77-13-4) TaxID=660122 RepID=C7ZIG1_FUSV7|nr:uncharacterized protein NECHADRAFT_87130 [Fusarium vanettenii 77-13-4]EEU36257.1 hypothetical protein NECHADRAFT_87130 [Fusarium vanettenii 77-13-4]